MKRLLPLLAVLLTYAAAAVHAADRPNVVWIVSEDNSVHYLGPFLCRRCGNAPNIESLAEKRD